MMLSYGVTYRANRSVAACVRVRGQFLVDSLLTMGHLHSQTLTAHHQTKSSEMAYRVKVFSTKPDNLGLILGPKLWGERRTSESSLISAGIQHHARMHTNQTEKKTEIKLAKSADLGKCFLHC